MKRKLLVALAVVLGVQTIATPAFAPLEIRELTINVTVDASPTPATISETNGGKETVVANDLVLSGVADCAGAQDCLAAGLQDAAVSLDADLQLTRRDGSPRLQGRMTALTAIGGIVPGVGGAVSLRARVRGIVAACESGVCQIDLRVEGTLLSSSNQRVGTAQFELGGVLASSTQGVAWVSLGGSGTLSFTTTWDPTAGGV